MQVYIIGRVILLTTRVPGLVLVVSLRPPVTVGSGHVRSAVLVTKRGARVVTILTVETCRTLGPVPVH